MMLTDKVAIVTGAAQGIGRGIAKVLGRAGAAVVIADVQPAEDTIAMLRHGGVEAISVVCDVTDPAQVEEMTSRAHGLNGRIDILVNNAGLDFPLGDPFTLSLEEWNRTLAVNLTGMFICARAVLPAMRDQGGGSIVNIASDAALIGYGAVSPAYPASKGGVLGFTVGLSSHVIDHSIRVNAVIPSSVESRDFGWTEAERNHILRDYPLGLGHPDDVGQAVRYLSSEAARWITGSSIYLNGGLRHRGLWPVEG
jgi:NAD(P)-dependent dehydrogenase (short-subunit alcohol dehydrogenase family)